MNRSIIAIVLACVVVSALGIYRFFIRYNPGINPNAVRPVIHVFTHSSFMSPTGPGPEVAALFEASCHCEIRFNDAGSGGLLLQKLKLGGPTRADVVLGLDQLLLKEAVLTVKWRNLSLPIRNWHAVIENNSYANFIPYDWSPIAIITKAELPKVSNLKELIAALPEKSLSLPDPKFSTPGTQLLYWLYTYHPDAELQQVFEALAPKIFAIGPDWSSAYGLFRRGQAKFGLGYLSSLVYHWQEEKDRSYKAIILSEPHPAQIEYAGVPDSCLSCGLAERFVEFLSSDEAQKIIMQKNYMLPVVKDIAVGTLFADLPNVDALTSSKFDIFLDRKDGLLKMWDAVFKK